MCLYNHPSLFIHDFSIITNFELWSLQHVLTVKFNYKTPFNNKTRWKMVYKNYFFYENVKNKLKDVVRYSLIFFFFIEIFSLSGGEEKKFTKNKRWWKASIHKNENVMEMISP